MRKKVIVDEDTGVVLTLVKRFETQRLLHAHRLKQKVDRGEPLNDADLAFLATVQKDGRYVTSVVRKRAEWQLFMAQATALYKTIMDKALTNLELPKNPKR